MVWVLYQSESTMSDRLVLLAIADDANDDGADAYPSMERIAAKARVSKSTAIRCVEALEASGELLVKRPDSYGRGRFNRYMLTMGRDPRVLASAIGWPAPRLGERCQVDTVPEEERSAGDGFRCQPEGLSVSRVTPDPRPVTDPRSSARLPVDNLVDGRGEPIILDADEPVDEPWSVPAPFAEMRALTRGKKREAAS